MKGPIQRDSGGGDESAWVWVLGTVFGTILHRAALSLWWMSGLPSRRPSNTAVTRTATFLVVVPVGLNTPIPRPIHYAPYGGGRGG